MRELYRIAVAVLFLISGCTKIETTDIGSGLIPPIDGVTTLDTSLDVITDNIINSANDSLRVYYNDDHVIGIINNDPLFGKTSAKACFELKPTSYAFSFTGGSSVVPDSAVLILSYKGVFGDSITNQNWEVKELTELMDKDSTYAVSKEFATGNILGSKNVDIREFDDSVKNDFELADNQIRIKLSQDFAYRFIKQYDSTDNNAYKNDSLFRLNFKGFSVGPAAGSPGNALIRVNLSDTNTKLALFYNYKNSGSDTAIKTVSYFRFSSSYTSIPVSGSASYIHRDHSSSDLGTALLNSTANDSLLYIQTSPGTIATIQIPGLSGLPNSIIHRAELAMYEVPDANAANPFTEPQYLLLYSDSTGKQKVNVPNDFTYSSTSGVNTFTFGGYLVQRNVPDYGVSQAYIFDLTRYVQGIVTRHDTNLPLRLYAPSRDSLNYMAPYPSTAMAWYYIAPTNANNVATGRVVLAGGATSRPTRMRLRIIYSKI